MTLTMTRLNLKTAVNTPPANLGVADFFSVKDFPAPELLASAVYAWDPLKSLKAWCAAHAKKTRVLGTISKHAIIEGPVVIGKGTIVEAGAYIRGPVVIGKDCEIRHNAYIRGDVVIGDGAVVGNSCEIKHAVLGQEAEIPHLAYVGDSLLGRKAHLGAGVIVSNVKLTRDTIQLTIEGRTIDTGLKKFGAVVGDETEVGCNCVLNPGSLLGPRSLMYPNVSWSGFLPAAHIVKYRPGYHVLARRKA